MGNPHFGTFHHRRRIPDIEERLFICDVKNEDEAHGIAEKGGGQRTESVPKNMQLHIFDIF
jgi:hypothetical protein